jgi:hypothetical protein
MLAFQKTCRKLRLSFLPIIGIGSACMEISQGSYRLQVL